MLCKFRSSPRDEATEKIECYIMKNNLSANAKLPSERDMCEMWGFNRTTLRSAIQRLIIEGELCHRKGSGTFVASPKLVRNLLDLKPLAVLAADMGKTLTSKVISALVIESTKQITKKLHLLLGHKVYALTRLRFIDEEPAIIETCYVDYERFPGIESHDFGSESLYNVLDNSYGAHITKGQQMIGITYTTGEEAQLLGIEEEASVFYLTGIVSDENDVPIEYFKSVVRPDLVRFASMLTR